MEHEFVGLKIAEVRPMTVAEGRAEGWDGWLSTHVIVLEDGTKLYASQDEEGNGPGAIFGVRPDGDTFLLA